MVDARQRHSLDHLFPQPRNTLGATVLGAILNAGINHYASGEAAAGLHDALNQPTGLSALAADPAIRAVFNAALHWSFWGVVIVAVLTFFTTG